MTSLFEPNAAGIGYAKAERLSTALRALSEPHRLRLLSLMAQAEWTNPVELERQVPLAQSTIAHHLRVLLAAGLVERKRVGVFHPYRIRQHGFNELRELLQPWTGDL